MATKRVRISNDSLNSYGTRVLTSGLDVSQYEKNPVLLWMHERGTVVGRMKDLKKADGELTGEPVFDEVTELSRQLKAQWEAGSLRMVSIGAEILATSKAKADIVDGQTRPTVTRSKLMEVSVVDIGANDDAIVLEKEGRMLELKDGGSCVLPLLEEIEENEKDMEREEIALALGLEKGAEESEVKGAVESLKAAKAALEEKVKSLEAARDAAEAESAEQLVEAAVKDGRLVEGSKAQMLDLAKKVGLEGLKKTLEAIPARSVKLSSLIGGDGGAASWKKLSDVPAKDMAELRRDDPELYKELYKAEYGMECEIKG